jgi:hypothetical protein
VLPPGFKIVLSDRRSVVCQEGDEAWVRQALAEVKPTTMPTTMPSDLLEKLSELRDVLSERVARDLGLTDAALPRKLIDEQVLPLLRSATDFDPPVFYMVSSEATVRELIKNGWENPLFYYNRAANRVAINTRVDLSLTETMDDTLLPAMYEPNDDFQTRRTKLLDAIRQTEGSLARQLAVRAEASTQLAFVGLIISEVVRPMELGVDQEWFGIGVSSALSWRYLALVNGLPEDAFVGDFSRDVRGNPIRIATIDLLHPTNADDMRENYRRAYIDAYQRKSTKVIDAWYSKLPPGGLSRTLAAVKGNKPKDGATLVKLIADTTGVDLTKEAAPQQ